MATVPFGFIELPNATTKPRSIGRTMVIDWGLPLGLVTDSLALTADYIDVAKIAVGTARLYPEEMLRHKLALYEEHGVAPFIGGQFGEYVLALHGMSRMDRFYAEAARLGFRAIEVSDNTVEITLEERAQLIRLAREAGLHVHGEVGSKTKGQEVEELIRHAEVSFEAGCDVVLVEAAELFAGGEPREDLLDAVRSRLDPARVIYELPGPWIEGTTASDIYRIKRFLFEMLGPEVNIGNLPLADVLETQALRSGLSVVGPRIDRKDGEEA